MIHELSADDAITLLEQYGIATARLRTTSEFAQHPQLTERDRWRQIDTPNGVVQALVPLVSVAGRDPLMLPVPALGEHTAAVRSEFGRP